jgi:limonene-1,2-epoxide hydrolase
MTTEKVIDRLIDAILNRDSDKAAALLAEDVVFKDPMGSTNGRQAVHDMYRGFFQAASNIEWKIINKIINGNTAVIERVNHITLEGGKKIILPIVTVAEVLNGKIQNVRDYFDFKTFNDQVSA